MRNLPPPPPNCWINIKGEKSPKPEEQAEIQLQSCGDLYMDGFSFSVLST